MASRLFLSIDELHGPGNSGHRSSIELLSFQDLKEKKIIEFVKKWDIYSNALAKLVADEGTSAASSGASAWAVTDLSRSLWSATFTEITFLSLEILPGSAQRPKSDTRCPTLRVRTKSSLARRRKRKRSPSPKPKRSSPLGRLARYFFACSSRTYLWHCTQFVVSST